MTRRVGDICSAGEKYKGRDGEEKTRWIKCGVLLETDRGFRIKMDCIPLHGDGWFAVFEEDRQQDTRPAPKAEPVRAQPQRPDTGPAPEDDIPF